MSDRAWLLLSWVLVGAAVLVSHAVLVWRAIRSTELGRAARWFALIPVVTPIVAWRAGHRVTVAMWIVLLAAYVGLRAVEW